MRGRGSLVEVINAMTAVPGGRFGSCLLFHQTGEGTVLDDNRMEPGTETGNMTLPPKITRLAAIGGTDRFVFLMEDTVTGVCTWTSEAYSEEEIRAYFRDVGMPELDVDAELSAAWKRPI